MATRIVNSAGSRLSRPRTPGLRNRFRLDGETAFIILRRTAGEDLEAAIDVADLETIKAIPISLCATWQKSSKTFYAKGKVNGKTVYLHRIIAGIPGADVDHRDWNGLNCRRSNLRSMPRELNARHQKLKSNTITGFKGVSRMGNRFVAYINYRSKKTHLGMYATAEEASRAVRGKLRSMGLDVYGAEFCEPNTTGAIAK